MAVCQCEVMMKRRVVVTGMGVVSSVGNNVSEMWKNLVNGKCGIDYITLFNPVTNKVKIAGEVKNLDFEEYLDSKECKRLDRAIIFALIASIQAFNDSHLAEYKYDPDRFGTFVTSGVGGFNTIFTEAKKGLEKGFDRLSPFFATNAIINLIGGNIAIKFNAKGPALPVVTACSAGTNAIGEAFRYIRDGYIDLAFAGGTEAGINELGVGGFTAMHALNTSNDIHNASIPFDKKRSGFVMAEGAGVLILEEYEHAKKRGAKIYAEVVGYGTTCDAFHVAAPDEKATGITKCIKLALKDANINPEQIDYINAHGTSTYYNDKLETLAIKNVFADYAYKVNISSTKSMTGHALGATGAIEAIISIQSILNSIIPPTINLRDFDEECDLNYTPNVAIEHEVNYAMSNSLGFGGQNAVLIFKKYKEV